MPDVQGNKFPYTSKGKKAAKKYAKKTGKKMTYDKMHRKVFGLKK